MPQSSLQCIHADCATKPTFVVDVHFWFDDTQTTWSSEHYVACPDHVDEAKKLGLDQHGEYLKNLQILDQPAWLLVTQQREELEAFQYAENFFRTGESPTGKPYSDKPSKSLLRELLAWGERGGQVDHRRGGRKERR